MATMQNFDAREFRGALGSFTTGVTIVTARAPNGEPVGVTANSFNSVSLDPPMILWSLAKSSRSLAAFDAASNWIVHILAADQEDLSNRFAKSSSEKFAGLEVETGVGDTPMLKGCVCRLQCKTAFKYEGGDHMIFVGEVVAFDRRDVPSLVFHQGKYALAARKAGPEVLSGNQPRESDISYGEDFLGYLLWRAYLHFRIRVMVHLEAQQLDVDSFMILAMLLHHDGRNIGQLASGLLQSGADGTATQVGALASRGLVRVQDEEPIKVWLTDTGRNLTLRIHAASQAIESDLLDHLEASERMAFKHLLRRFIVLTDGGLPHPWNS